MNHGSLFSGIGGFDLASEWMGWENVFHCEYNDFSQKVLKYYWPSAISYGDIKQTDFSIHRGEIDILTGGFPCQPYSLAGKRKGKEDERHLWPEMLRAIREIQPTWIVGENVFGLINWSGGLVFDEVQADLEDEGYEVWAYVLPACAVNAPHRRDRIWFIAYLVCERFWKSKGTPITNEERQSNGHIAEYGKIGSATNASCKTIKHSDNKRAEYKPEKRGNTGVGTSPIGINRITPNANGRRQSSKEYGKEESGRIAKKSLSDYWENFPTQSPICGRNDGIPSELVGITFPKWRNESIKAFGNAIVPQVVYQLFKAIEEFNKSPQ